MIFNQSTLLRTITVEEEADEEVEEEASKDEAEIQVVLSHDFPSIDHFGSFKGFLFSLLF